MSEEKKQKKSKTIVKKQSDERRLRLQEVLKEINKEHGANSVKFGSDEPAKSYLPTGIADIDGFSGGLTRGNFSIYFGGESCGKTTLALQTIAHLQKQGFVCCLIDLEHSFDIKRAEFFGVNMSELVLVEHAETAEQAMDITIKLSRTKVVDLIVIDSIQAMSPEGEQVTKKGKEISVSSDTMALLARKLGQFLRICATPIYNANIAVFLIGQVRTHGIGSFATFEGLSGGKAVLHWAYQITNVRRGQKADAPSARMKESYVDDDGKNKTRVKLLPVGFNCVLTLQKNKSSNSKPEGSQLHVPFYFATGFVKPLEGEETAVDENIDMGPAEETASNGGNV